MQQLTLPLSSNDLNIRRSARAKRLRISINALGHIEVVAPDNTYAREIEQFVESQRDWIRRTKCHIESIRNSELNSRIPKSIQLPAIEEQWQIIYTSGCSKIEVVEDCVTDQGVLRLSIEHEIQAGELLKKWLNNKAKSVLLPWLEKISDETGLHFSRATVRGQKTRWGSCSASKSISLNRCMLFLKPEQVRYLLIHELCHTIEMNHSKKFWNLVSQFVPDYRYQDTKVNECCYKLPGWAL